MTEFNPLNLNNKTFIITGAASGIGRAASFVLSKLGADLILFDINEKGLIETKCGCKNTDLIKTLDLSNEKALEEAIKDVVEIKGKINGFAHFAGIPCIAPLKAVNNEMCEKVLSINTKPVLTLSKILSNKRYMAEGGASFVLISSVYAQVGSSANVIYAMSKSAIQGVTKALAIELAQKKIRVNCIAPGFIKTEMGDKINHFFDSSHNDLLEKMHPLGMGSPYDVANAAAFLLSDMSKWITGAIINVDGGFCAQ